MKNVRALLVTGSMLAAAVGGSLALAGPASATQTQCENYLRSIGATVGSGARAACAQAVGDSWAHFGRVACMVRLTDLNVSAAHANKACNLAAED